MENKEENIIDLDKLKKGFVLSAFSVDENASKVKVIVKVNADNDFLVNNLNVALKGITNKLSKEQMLVFTQNMSKMIMNLFFEYVKNQEEEEKAFDKELEKIFKNEDEK